MNAIVIEQTPEETSRAFEVHQGTSISRIRLARAKVAALPMDEAPKNPISIRFTFRSKAISSPAGVLRLEIAFRMAGAAERKEGRKGTPETKPEAAVNVECVYEVDYALSDGFEIVPEQIKAFKDGNALFNTWPYFREYLQNSLGRMGLPPLTAPFLRLQPKARTRKRASEELQ